MSKENLIPKINELITKLEETKTQSDFCVSTFAGSTEILIKELKAEREKVATHLNQLNNALAKCNETSTTFLSSTRVLSVLPEKIDEKLEQMPKNFTSSIKNTIPDLSKELIDQLEKELKSIRHQAEALLNTTNSQMTSAITTFKGGGNQIFHDMRHEINVYKSSMEDLLRKSFRSRIINFFWTVLISGAFSSFVAISTFWYIVRV